MKGDRFFKIYEDFGDGYAIANEQGVIEIANNDRERDDGTIADEFKDFESAEKFLKEEKGLNVDEMEFSSIDVSENVISLNY